MLSLDVSRTLTWFPELGIGWYPVPDTGQYDAKYWERYRRYDASSMGEALTGARLELVGAHAPHLLEDIGFRTALVDVGIGGGRFVSQREHFQGYDVNPAAVGWLREQGRLWDTETPAPAFTFWDSLEHIAYPAHFLSKASKWVFTSLPIFRDSDHILRSKHFRKDEHFWYFTHEGLIRFMKQHGFRIVDHNDIETVLGREDIRSYAFRRMA